MHLKNIIIDNGGVLSSPKTGNWFITTNFWIIINIDEKANIEIMKNTMKKFQYLLTQEPKSETEEHNMFSNFYFQVLKEFGYKNLSLEIANKLASDCVYNDDKYIFYSDVDEELEVLSTKYDLYMITDAWPSSYRVLDNRNISKYFKKIMISSMESKTKLEGLFKIFLEKNNNVIPEESIYIDDRSVILDEATNCGFNVLLMDRKCECNDSKYNIIHELSEIESVADNI